MMKSSPFRLKAIAAATTLGLAINAGAATLTVTNALDSGAGSLRTALTTIQGDTGCTGAPYIVNFNIPTPATGEIEINVGALTAGTPLPTFSCQTLIDGYSQPGTVRPPLTPAALGPSVAGLRIFLNGTAATSAPQTGIRLGGNGSVVRGIAVGNFSDTGIALEGSNAAHGNFVGLRADGSSSAPNGNGIAGFGINATVGGPLQDQRNVIGSNLGVGVNAYYNWTVQNNLIGTASDGISARGNAIGVVPGIERVTIGGMATGEANAIAHNAKGIATNNFSNTGYFFTANSIFSNLTIGIDLGNNGQTPNDPAETDNHQNFPVINGVTFSGGNTAINYTLNTAPNRNPLTVEFFGNTDTAGQGRVPLPGCAQIGLAANGSGVVGPLTANCTGVHLNITATATYTLNTFAAGTSEFSPAFLSPDMTPSSTTGNLGAILVGGSSTMFPLSIQNTGLGSLNIDSLVRSLPDFVDTAGGAPPRGNHWCGIGSDSTGAPLPGPAAAAIPSGGTCTMLLIFAPQTSGARNATLTYSDAQSPSGPVVINLSGTGVVADILPAFSFGSPSIPAGSTTALTLNLDNQNLQPYSVGSVTVTLPAGLVVAPAPAASLSAPCTGTVSATPGAGSYQVAGLAMPTSVNCNIAVDVTSPTPGTYPVSITAGAFAGGALAPSGAAVTNATSNTASLVVNAALAPVLGVTPLTVTFPNTALGVLSAPVGVTVTNSGTAPLTFLAPITTAAPFAVANGCPVAPATLPIGANCNLNVTFQPSVVGAQTGTISIGSDGGTLTVGLAGTGQVIPPSVTFGFTLPSVTIGNPSVLQMTIGNANGAPFNNPSFSYNLPPGLVVDALPNETNPAGPCLGSFVPPSPGATSFMINALSVPTGGSCAFSLALTSAAAGTYSVSMASGAIVGSVLTQTGVNNAASNTAALVVTAAPSPVLSTSPPPPGPLAFGNVTVGALSAPQTVTLTNAGTAPLNFSGQPVLSTSPAAKVAPVVTGEFAVNTATTLPCPATLPPAPGPGNSCTIEVKFAPTVVGPASGTLGIASDGGSVSFNLTGTGTALPAPAVSLSTSGLTFASQLVGTVSSPQVVLLDNVGTAPLALSAITSGGDFGHSSNCPFAPSTIPANSGCDISVTFSPLLTGGRTGTLSITSNASGSPHAVALTGTGTAAPVPGVSVSPSPVTFPATVVGSTSAPQSVLVTNTGGVPLAVSVAEIVGSGFSIVSNGCTTTVVAGADCIITLVFSPPSAGTISATLRLISNAPGSPTLVTLSGTGSAGALATLSATPASLTFAERAIGSTSPAQAVTIGNTGGATATISGIAVTGDYAQTNNCASVAVGESCTVSVTFTPTATGSRPGSIAVAADATNSPVSIALSGSGTPPPEPVIELSVTSLSYGNTLVGRGAGAQSVTVRNAGGAPLAISGLDLRGEFSVANGCTAAVAPGGTCRLDVVFAPTIPGSRIGRLDVRSNASNGTKGVDLAGTGCRFSFLNRSLTLLCQ